MTKFIVKITIILTVPYFVVSSGCQCNRKPTVSDSLSIDTALINEVSSSKKIFYSLPSPLETALLLKNAGAKYDESLLNPLSNVSKYTSSKNMAINMGIYTTDLSFASLFDQTQTSLKYMDVSKKLAEGLDIKDAIDNNTLKRIEENLDNREVIMDIISDAFMSSSSYLKENDREPIADMLLAGGWIEGLYIATRLVSDKNFSTDNKLVERILDQKLSFEILKKMLAQHKNNPDITNLLTIFNELTPLFEKVTVKNSDMKVEYDSKSKVTTLDSGSTFNISKEDFFKLSAKIQEIRTAFIQ
jgi:hypothetical protein